MDVDVVVVLAADVVVKKRTNGFLSPNSVVSSRLTRSSQLKKSTFSLFPSRNIKLSITSFPSSLIKS